jgi:glutamine synthetase
LLRGAIATAGNDHRLEQMKRHSVFIGEQLTKVLAELEGVTAGKLSPGKNRFKIKCRR